MFSNFKTRHKAKKPSRLTAEEKTEVREMLGFVKKRSAAYLWAIAQEAKSPKLVELYKCAVDAWKAENGDSDVKGQLLRLRIHVRCEEFRKLPPKEQASWRAKAASTKANLLKPYVVSFSLRLVGRG